MANTLPLHDPYDFKERLRLSLQDKATRLARHNISKHENVYFTGDRAETVYFIDSGQIKLLMCSPTGKECLLRILTSGDTFGELCLAGAGLRQETATAMTETSLRLIPCPLFFSHLVKHSLVEGFLQHLAALAAEQQQIIARLLTMDCEQRLGETLLMLARKLGKQAPCCKLIEQKITHEELSRMVGTTRPRVTEFMLRFRDLGLISMSREHFLVVDEIKLAEYLAQLT